MEEEEKEEKEEREDSLCDDDYSLILDSAFLAVASGV